MKIFKGLGKNLKDVLLGEGSKRKGQESEKGGVGVKNNPFLENVLYGKPQRQKSPLNAG